MANENTISDLINRIKIEGQLTRNTGTNSIKTLVQVSNDIRARMDAQLALMAENNTSISDFISDTARQNQYDRNNAGDGDDRDSPYDTSGRQFSDSRDYSFPNLGLLSTLAAGAIGGTIGVLKGWVNAIKFFTPKTIIDAVSDVAKTIKAALVSFGEMGKASITSAKNAIFGSLSFLNRFKDFFTKLVDPFTDAIKTVSGLMNSVFDVSGKVKGLLAYFKSFSSMISKISSVIGKIFLPITIVMTAIDTVRGIIEGYTADGITGALEGAITGFFNSLIFGPLDLLKDMTSWVVSKLGFENASSVLDSFSFSELFTNLISGIFDLIGDIFTSLTGSFNTSVDSFKASGIWTGLGNSLNELFKLMVVKPLDLLKDLVSWAADLFGFDNASAWLDSFSISELFDSVKDWISTIPKKIVHALEDMWIDTIEKFKLGLVTFANWVASIPDRIYLNALETFKGTTIGGYLIDDSSITEARAAVQSRDRDVRVERAKVRVEAREQRAELIAQRVQEAAAASSAQVSGPPVIINGGNTTRGGDVYTNQTIVTTQDSSRALSSYNQFMAAGAQ